MDAFASAFLSIIALLFTVKSPPHDHAVSYVANRTADQVMDVYWTAGRPKATVLFIHGGSLEMAGERRGCPPAPAPLGRFVAGRECLVFPWLTPSRRHTPSRTVH